MFRDPGANAVKALDRGLNVLEALAESGTETLTELSLRLGLPASTTHRLLTTFEQHHVVEFDDVTQRWSIGIEAFRIGSAFVARTNLVAASQPIMGALMEETGETANLAIRDNDDVVFVSQIETRNPVRALFRPGTRAAMHASGSGKAILSQVSRADVERILRHRGLTKFTKKTITSPRDLFADLAQAQARGWATDDEERYEGMRCVAATIRDAHGAVAGAISVSGPAARFDEQKIAQFGLLAKRAAEEITAKIGGLVGAGQT